MWGWGEDMEDKINDTNKNWSGAIEQIRDEYTKDL